MATVLDSSPPFLENFSYATLLAEDGRPMHKSWGNSIEFNEAADRMGVDVMRWLYSAHKPENDLLFGYNRGDETRRRFLIPLWNVYSFLVTYARLDGWQPEYDFDPAHPEGPTPQSSNLLDRWIMVRLNTVLEQATKALNNSDTMAATQAAEVFLDDLSNWYVRRSRRRFWKSEHDEDKNTAYATLYYVVVRLARILAPLIPFVTEAMYQNLVRRVHSNARLSVHHTAWPVPDPLLEDEVLPEQMALARQISSLGLSARNSAGIKVRQPLAKVIVYAGGKRTLSPELVEIVEDELNVKDFEFVDEAAALVAYVVLPNNKLLGPRFGAQFPAVRKALSKLDPGEVAETVNAGESLTLQLDGERVELSPEEILVQTEAAEGLAVASDKLATVAINATITPELKAEGLAREIVRRVQAMRKDAGFDISDRIRTFYQAGDELGNVFVTYADYIQAETLTTELSSGEPSKGAFVQAHTIDGEDLVVGVERV
jgi:isoleucyl-tRNA synthetase